jgi:iron(II)-dependent oxidoreductase
MDDFAHPDADGPPHGEPHHDSTEMDHAADVLIPGGTFVMGTSDDPWAYDNERPEHDVTLAPFRIDTTPTTNGSYRAFVDAGGYDDSRLWTDAGWAWRQEAALEAPQFWHREGGGAWSRRRFGRVEDLPLDEPVQHVCWYEADAFARWSGGRLPTETEWEIAAAGATIEHSNLWRAGPHRFGPSDVTRSPADATSKWGVRQMFGDVWEWTASDFGAYPGFVAFPYREYSEVFFGPDYKVLRGGSWATHPAAMRASFRNWDYPVRRQIFSGFRCARDA